MKNRRLLSAMDQLGNRFRGLNWDYPELFVGKRKENILYWPGDPKEDIMICVLKDFEFQEDLHRHDFFFLNYAYRYDYQALSEKNNNLLTIHEGECYIGQPFSGYGLRQSGDAPAIVIGVLVQKEMFFRDFLPVIASDPAIFHFFLNPRENAYSEEFLHFSFSRDSPVRSLLEMMVIEYANAHGDTQTVLKPLVSTLLLYVARRYREVSPPRQDLSLCDQIIRYISEHTDSVTLNDIGRHFSYHPNYISGLLRKETGNTFSDILLQLRMERAAMLLKGTALSVEEIAAMLGYGNSSGFYKAFREYYHISPREYIK